MESVLRGAAVYLFLLIVFRVAGKRSMVETTTFDFVLLLIISEATQQALMGEDFSVTNGIIVIVTMVALDIGLSFLKQRSKKVDRLLDSVPIVIAAHGRALRDRMDRARIDEDDILEAARGRMGLERIEQIKYAVLEKNGDITIVPMEPQRAG